jgi:hypothetical protein
MGGGQSRPGWIAAEREGDRYGRHERGAGWSRHLALRVSSVDAVFSWRDLRIQAEPRGVPNELPPDPVISVIPYQRHYGVFLPCTVPAGPGRA